MEVHEKFLTMDRKAFIEYFNSQNFSWKITDYNRTFQYGCLESPIGDEGLPRECNVLLQDLPKNFDAREKWPQCETIKEIYNQGHCGSCWTFGAATSASDRTCIHKNTHVHLAEQDFECCLDHVCEGGIPYFAFSFWQKEGLVTNKCKPYDIEKLNKNTCEKECVDRNISYTKDKHYAEKVYQLDNDVDCIKSELAQNGPIQASFVVFEDFPDYR
ncbi:unnamed protein product [Arctia plantaginis]|uniref:Peptidase C1A papain C-terminal domain-containing protein n=1 Tax=Arctia plantaginis TaxID=874455 RepID=A0A8S1BGI0_ARCPL|nr:unnamed protein product [Arctia plantaginis]